MDHKPLNRFEILGNPAHWSEPGTPVGMAAAIAQLRGNRAAYIASLGDQHAGLADWAPDQLAQLRTAAIALAAAADAALAADPTGTPR